MDPLQLLGSLLGSNPTASNNNHQILGQLIGGLTGGAQAAGAPTATPAPGAPAAPVGGVNIGGLLGGLALTALQSFMQRSTPGAQSPLAALAAMLGGGAGSGQSPLAALAGMLGFGSAAAATPAGVAAAANLSTQVQQQALALVQAMINAAKADGRIDEQEKQHIVSRLAGVGSQEMDFVQQELTKPLNMDFLRNIDPAMATEAYTLSLMAINLDTQAEIEYMQYLAQQLGLNPQTVNNIHQQLGLNPLFA